MVPKSKSEDAIDNGQEDSSEASRVSGGSLQVVGIDS